LTRYAAEPRRPKYIEIYLMNSVLKYHNNVCDRTRKVAIFEKLLTRI